MTRQEHEQQHECKDDKDGKMTRQEQEQRQECKDEKDDKTRTGTAIRGQRRER